MRWASAVSERVDTRAAVREAASALMAEQTRPPDLVLAFVSSHHAAAYEDIGGFVREVLGDAQLVGTSAAGVIGGSRELEGREAVSLTAAWLPNTRVRVMHVSELPREESSEALAQRLSELAGDQPNFLVFADPYTCDAERLLRGLDLAFPNSIKAGGLASGAGAEQSTALFHGQRVHHGGALIVALDGALEMQAFVAQSCRPVGDAYIVTRTRGNVIQAFNAGKPTDVLRKTYENMDARDLSLFNSSLFLGVEMGGKTGRYEAGDFLIRNILGIDPESGAMAIDMQLSNYQVVQFHLRDKQAAANELVRCLRALAPDAMQSASHVRGMLMFPCLGRGERLFGVANHDSDAVRSRLNPPSLSGFFCSGEIAPVGGSGKTHLHGYTSVLIAFCERS